MSRNSLNQWIKIDNGLARAAQDLTVLEQRIIWQAIAQLPPSPLLHEKSLIRVPLQDVIRLGGDANGKSIYKNMRQAALSIASKCLVVLPEDAKGDELNIPWVSLSTYQKDEGAIWLVFNPLLQPYISYLRSKFSLFQLKEITGFKSKYSQVLYTRLMEFMRDFETKEIRDSWNRNISLEDLKRNLKAENYKRIADFKRYVLDPAVNDINNSDYTIFTIDWDYLQVGRRVVGIAFTMKHKKRPTDSDAPFKPLREDQLVMFADWLSGRNLEKLKMGHDPKKFFEFLKEANILKKKYSFNQEALKKFLILVLSNPEDLEKIYDPWLKRLGAKLERVNVS